MTSKAFYHRLIAGCWLLVWSMLLVSAGRWVAPVQGAEQPPTVAPWRRTTHGWERADWMLMGTADRSPWQRLHPAVLGCLQLGGSILVLGGLSRGREIRRA